MAGTYGIEQLGHDLLFALGQFGDGVELLLKFRHKFRGHDTK